MKAITRFPVILLTLLAVAGSGCTSYLRAVQQFYEDPCKNRAYVRMDVEHYISRRFNPHAPVRVAIIPFSVPANLASINMERPGLGNELAWQLHRELLRRGSLPMVEVLNRQDWPGKKEEFFTGNFGALALARQAGYDFVVVGYLDDIDSMKTLAAFGKMIEVDSGITVWYGRSETETLDPRFQRGYPWWWYNTRQPDQLKSNDLADALPKCFARNMLSHQPIP